MVEVLVNGACEARDWPGRLTYDGLVRVIVRPLTKLSCIELTAFRRCRVSRSPRVGGGNPFSPRLGLGVRAPPGWSIPSPSE